MSSPGSGLLALRQENGVGHLGVNTWHVAFPPPFHLPLPFMNLFAGGLSSCVGSDLSSVLGESLYSLGTQVEEIHAFHVPRQGAVLLQTSTYSCLEWVLPGLHLLNTVHGL